MSDAALSLPAVPVERVVPAAATPLPSAGELRDDELEQVVGGLARVWLPAPVAHPPGRPG